jgi:hypothetical protein
MENKKSTQKIAPVKAKKETKKVIPVNEAKKAIPVKEIKKTIPIKEIKKEIPLKDKKEIKKVVPAKGKKAAKKEVSSKDKKKSKKEVIWLSKPIEENYTAANSFLGLIYDAPACFELMKELKSSPIVEFKARDIFRAAGITSLGANNSDVEKERKKIKKHVGLSPILLARDFMNKKVTIADGYYRLCAVYAINKDSVIPCTLV